MTDTWWDRIRRDKQRQRASSAAKPFGEKVQVLEKLRERDAQFKLLRGEYAARRQATWPTLQTAGGLPSSGSLTLQSSGANATLIALVKPSVPVPQSANFSVKLVVR